MDLNDKASESPDVHLIRDAQYSAYRLESTELTPADEISEEDEFPQFGDFLETSLSEDGEGPPMYVECPQDVARQLVEFDIGEGDWFRIGEAVKVDGEWSVDVSEGADRAGDEDS